MTLEQTLTTYRIPTTGIIHIGGEGAELAEYERLGFKRILFIQSDPTKFERIREATRLRPHALGVRCGVGPENGHSLADGKLCPSRRLDTLLVEMGVHPKEFTVVQVVLELDRETWAQDLGAHHLESHVQVFCGQLHRPAQINLWQQPHGRFANEIFQHFFARRLVDKYRLTLELRTAPWGGQALFGISDPLLERALPVVEEHDPDPEKSDLWDCLKWAGAPIGNVCLHGNFQFHTGLWDHDDRQTFRQLYNPVPALKRALRDALEKAMGGGKTLVAIHLRQGDYTDHHPGMFYRTPRASYLKWLEEIWPLLDKPVLYVATDDLNVVQEFKAYCPLTRESLGVDIPEEYYVDFWVLTQAHALAISNSSFSFAAAMLNEKAWSTSSYVRPLRDGTLIPFDPWNADVLLGRYDYKPSSEETCHKLIVELLAKLDPRHEGDVIEVGLGTGNWLFTELAPRKYRCHAVEPLPVAELEAAVQAYGVSLTRAAMGPAGGLVNLYKGRSPDLNSLNPMWWGCDQSAVPFKVESVTLPVYLVRAGITRLACLKVDVEGQEVSLIGQLRELKDLPTVVMWEFGGTPRAESGGGWGVVERGRTIDCLRVLRSLGYTTLFTVENGHDPVVTKFADLNPEEWEMLAVHGSDYGNFLAVKEYGT